MSHVRVRFAPSPTGPLHLGGARTALANWLFARKHGGTFLLRIEDTDPDRSSPEWEKLILQDLSWLGLDPDEGPDQDGPYGPYRQSERLSLYRSYAERLLEEGKAYRCFCTPEELEQEREVRRKAGRAPRYSGRCRTLSSKQVQACLAEGLSYTIRFRVEAGAPIVFRDLIHGEVRFGQGELSDFIILKGDGWPTYLFASVVDDHLMEISHVIRGEDHLPNTPRQLLLYRALGFETPTFAHLPLLLGLDRTPLSKRHGATAISEFREAGYLPETLVNYLALLGWSPEGGEEILSRERLIESFDLARLNRASPVFDPKKLEWLNSRYLRKVDLGRLVELAAPYLRKAGLIPETYDPDYLRRAIQAVRDGVSHLAEIPEQVRVFFHFDPRDFDPEANLVLVASCRSPVVGRRTILEALREELLNREVLAPEDYPGLVKALEQKTGLKGKALFRPLRAALTGRMSGPELSVLIPTLGKEECLRRLEMVVKVWGSHVLSGSEPPTDRPYWSQDGP